MKIVEHSDEMLVMQAKPWISILLHGLLGMGFLAGFLISAWVGEDIWLTIGMAICFAFILRIFLFNIAATTVRFDRKSDQISVVVTKLRGWSKTVHKLSELAGTEIGHDRDGDADRVILHFGPDREDAILPANSNGFFASSGQAEALNKVVEDWCRTR